MVRAMKRTAMKAAAAAAKPGKPKRPKKRHARFRGKKAPNQKARRDAKPRNISGSQTPLRKAIERVGGQAEVARQLGITQQSVLGWVERNHLPAARVMWLAAKSGIKRSELRPDLYAEGE